MKKKPHPYADLFPMMTSAELDALAEDVKANGLRHAVVLYKGLTLDGRNRLLACEKAGVEPRFEEFFVIRGRRRRFQRKLPRNQGVSHPRRKKAEPSKGPRNARSRVSRHLQRTHGVRIPGVAQSPPLCRRVVP
jgi:hypothetical protein